MDNKIKLTSPRRLLSGRTTNPRQRGGVGSKARVAVPSFFTLMNLFCGFVAITQIHQSQFVYACYLIILAGLFDLLDGMTAPITCRRYLGKATNVRIDRIVARVSPTRI